MKQQSDDMTKTLLEIVQNLNGDFVSEKSLLNVLQSIRVAVSFGAAFIYECDHAQHLFLHEHRVAANWIHLPETINPKDFLNPPQIAILNETPVQYVGLNKEKTELETKLCEMFSANSIFIVFITDSADTLLGCVGMVDQRKHFPLTESQVHMVNHMLKLVAERSRLRIYKQRLHFVTQTLENTMDHTGFDIYVNDYETHEMLYANKSMAAPYGGWEHMKNKTCHAALYNGQPYECSYCPKHHLIDENGNPTKIYSWDYQRPFDQAWFRVICAAFRWVDGRLAQVISSTDITDAKKNELLVQRFAYIDTLTGIGNRRKLQQDFEALTIQPNASENGITVLFLDLNKFKEINDQHGHAIGDLLLQSIANLFQENPITKDKCYRYGGDEFIYLFSGLSAQESAAKCKEIEKLLASPLCLNGIDMVCSGSIGFARYPDNGNSYDSILNFADTEMYKNKVAKKKAEKSAEAIEAVANK